MAANTDICRVLLLPVALLQIGPNSLLALHLFEISSVHFGDFVTLTVK